MKRIFAITFMLSALLLSPLVQSCRKEPVKPTDQTKIKLHEDPAKVTVTLVECHLHADWNSIQEIGGPHQNPESPAKHMKRVQTVGFELQKGKGWVHSEGTQERFYVQQCVAYETMGKATPAPVYLLFIDYYNADGEKMNGQFIENGQNAIHQHFFTPVNVRPTFDGKPEADDNDPEKLLDYLYTDTAPWDKSHKMDHAEITGKRNPVGLKGVVRFLKDRKEFDLKIRLYHGYESKVNPKTHAFDPFHTPSGVLIQRGTWDINVNVPVTVFWSRSEEVDIDPEADPSSVKEEDLDPDSCTVIRSIMHTFGITWTEAVEEFQAYTYKAGEVESGGIWL